VIWKKQLPRTDTNQTAAMSVATTFPQLSHLYLYESLIDFFCGGILRRLIRTDGAE
jgi:hypothetical protein